MSAEMLQYAATDAQVLLPLQAVMTEAMLARAWGCAWET